MHFDIEIMVTESRQHEQSYNLMKQRPCGL